MRVRLGEEVCGFGGVGDEGHGFSGGEEGI